MSGAWGVVLVAVLVAANGLFVAAEFSLVASQRTSAAERPGQSGRRSRLLDRELHRLPAAVSEAQVGITATSLGVGVLVERSLADTVVRPLLAHLGLPGSAALGVAVAIAFLVATVVQLVVGELVPKNVAIARPLGVALWVTPLTSAVGLVAGPAVRALRATAVWITEHLTRIPVRPALTGGHSLDELARIIAVSEEQGSLSVGQAALLQRAVGLGDRRVGEVMVPRPDVVWLTHDDTVADLRESARRTGHSRFPVRGATEDDVLGTVHVKDLLAVAEDARATTSITEVMAPTLAVPESEPLRRLLTDFRRDRRTFAVVVDEYGGTAGIVTLEDVLEQLVGDIEDEFDPTRRAARRVGVGRYLVRGGLQVDRVESLLGAALPDGPYETIAGFVLDRLGHIPRPGEVVEDAGLEVTVTRMEGVRVTEVAVRRTTPHVADGRGRE